MRVVALTETTAIGVTNGAQFDFMRGAVLDNAGRVTFTAYLDRNVGGKRKAGAWMASPDNVLRAIAIEGMAAPGADAGAVYYDFGEILVSETGRAVFSARLWTGTRGIEFPRDNGLFLNDQIGTQKVLIGGEVVNAGGPENVVVVQPDNGTAQYGINAQGDVGFVALSKPAGAPAGYRTGIWFRPTGGETVPIARQGDQVPGLPAGVSFGDYYYYSNPRVDDAGNVTFPFQLAVNDQVPDSMRDALWRRTSGGSLELLVREGTDAPGANIPGPFETSFGGFHPEVSPNGNTSMTAAVRFNRFGVWRIGEGGQLDAIAPPGGLVDGTADELFQEVQGRGINDRGDVLFSTKTSAGRDSLFLMSVDGSLKTILRSSDPAPGTEVGVLFRDSFSFEYETIESTALNNFGQVAVRAQLEPNVAGVSLANKEGIWATDRNGLLKLVVREGMEVEIGPGDIRTINSLGLGSGLGASTVDAFNDLGQIVFVATFTDGSGAVLVSNAVAVPEPGWFTQGILMTWLVQFRTRKRDVGRRSG